MGALASCAAVVLVGVLLFTLPDQPRAFAVSDVTEAMRRASVVQKTYPDGTVTWEGQGHFFARVTGDGNRAEYLNFVSGLATSYKRTRDCVLIYGCEYLPLFPSRAGEQTLRELLDMFEAAGQSPQRDWVQRERTIDGRRVIELTRKGPMAAAGAYVIDAQTERVLWTEGDAGRVEFSYPDCGPRDIYDLGVPRGVRVIDGSPSPQLLDLRRSVRAARLKGFGAYRMVLVSSVGGTGIHRIVTEGKRYRQEIDPFDTCPELTLAELRTVAKLYGSFGMRRGATGTIIFDGHKETKVWFDEAGQPAGGIVTSGAAGSGWMHMLDTISYGGSQGFFRLWERQDRFLGPDASGWLGYQAIGQANDCSRPWLAEAWFDPTHNYACCKRAYMTFPVADWQLDPDWQAEYVRERSPCDTQASAGAPATRAESEVLEWAELRPGQWYPAVVRMQSLVQAEDGLWQLRQRPNIANYSPETYQVVIAEPLDEIDPQWFKISEDWVAIAWASMDRFLLEHRRHTQAGPAAEEGASEDERR